MSCAGWTSDDQNVLFTYWRAVNVQVVLACITTGADVNARNEYGQTLLHLTAASTDKPAVITALIEAGADVNARTEDGETPLHAAAASTDSPAVITALIKAGANGAAANDHGKTPFDLAKENDAIKGSDAYWALNDARFK